MELQGISKLDLKRRNRAQILKVIRECGPISRVDIASSMQITRAAVTIITNEMIEEGVLYEVGEAPVSLTNLQKGRRKILIDINHDHRYIFGASISNKLLTVGLANLRGEVADKASKVVPADMTADEMLKFIVDSSKEILQKHDIPTAKILGMGIGIQPDMFSKLKIYLKDGSPDYSNVIQSISSELGVPITCSNLVAALALADILNLDLTISAKALFGFEGAKRRFEYKGSLKGVNIFDDYAHHPTEIKATLQAASTYPHKNMWVVFQPHTYSRTKAFMDEFAEALALSDNVVLTDIYAARENDNLGISSEDLRQKIENLGKKCWHFKSFSDIEDFLLQNCIPEDMLITMGAGDVLKIGENLLGS